MKYIETGMLIWLVLFIAAMSCFAVTNNRIENAGKEKVKKEHNWFWIKFLALAALIIFVINAFCEKVTTYFIN